MSDILLENDTCGRIHQTKRLDFLIDGEDYYRAFVHMARQARHHIFISGWTLDSRTGLLVNARGRIDLKLSAFLSSLIEKNDALGIYIMVWDFVGIYKTQDLMRLKPVFHLPWFAPVKSRIRVLRETMHPMGSAYHQCFVVIDDQVAFIGNTDFTMHGWDTQEHRMDDFRRFTQTGQHYDPIHTLTAMLEGPAARAMGDIFRERWLISGSELLPHLDPADPVFNWPGKNEPDLGWAKVALARTIPGDDAREQTHQIERLYLRAIAAAKRFIYIEDQYLTSSAVVQALAQALKAGHGPELVMVTSVQARDWMRQWSMGFLRDLTLDFLTRSDPHQRLGIYYPVSRKQADQAIKVKSNAMIVDDRLIILGSAHLNNRSMVLDIECDLAVDAADDPLSRQAVARLRDRLLAEHTGLSEEQVAQGLAESSMAATIATAQKPPGRALLPIPKPNPVKKEELNHRTVPLEQLLGSLVKAVEWPQRKRALIRFSVGLLAIVAIMYLWGQIIPDQYLDPEGLLLNLGGLAKHSLAPVVAILAITLGGALFIPLTVFIIITGAIFDPVLATLLSMAGVMLNSGLMYSLGLTLKPNYLRRLGGPKLGQMSRRLTQKAFWVMFFLRLMPVTPVQLVSVAAGVARMPLAPFLLGTMAGILPYTLLLIFLSGQIKGIMADPTPGKLALLIGIVLIIFVTGFIFIRSLEKTAGKNKKTLFAPDDNEDASGE